MKLFKIKFCEGKLILVFFALIFLIIFLQKNQVVAAENFYSMQMHIHGPFSEGISTIDSHTDEAIKNNVDVLWWTEHDFSEANMKNLGYVSSLGYYDSQNYAKFDFNIGVGSTGISPVIRDVPDSSPVFNLVQYWMISLRNSQTGNSQVDGYQYLESKVSNDGLKGELSFFVGGVSEATPGFKKFYYGLYSPSWQILRTPLTSNVRLKLDIRPTKENFVKSQYQCEGVNSNSKIIVRVMLSYHPQKGSAQAGKYILVYELTNSPFTAYLEPDKKIAHLPMPLPTPFQGQDAWFNEATFPITSDAVRMFPQIIAEDNNLSGIELGVEAQNATKACARFDNLRILYDYEGPGLFDRQLQLINQYNGLYPQVRQYQAIEYSGGGANRPHIHGYGLNKLPGETQNPYYHNYLQTNFRNYFTNPSEIVNVVNYIHSHGGIASSTHMFGTSWWDYPECTNIVPLDKAREFIANNVYGCDLLEVGLRRRGKSLSDFLSVWDTLSSNQVFITGIASSDDHGGPPTRLCFPSPHRPTDAGGFYSYFTDQIIIPWADQPNNFVTTVSAQDTSEDQLKLGLKKGNVFMKDTKLFKNGKIEISTNDNEKTGNVVIGHFLQKVIYMKAEGVQPGYIIRFIQRPIMTSLSPPDQAQLLTQYIRDEKYTASGNTLEKDVTITENNSFVRVEVCSPPAVGESICGNVDKVIGLSNPIYFIENEPVHSFLPEKRVLFCAGGEKGDLNCNGLINNEDLSILNSAWTTTGPVVIPPEARRSPDLNGDNKVDEIDMTTLMRNWTQ